MSLPTLSKKESWRRRRGRELAWIPAGRVPPGLLHPMDLAHHPGAQPLNSLLSTRKVPTTSKGQANAPWRRQWHPTPVLLPGKSHGWRSLVGCRPWGPEESDTTERLHFHFSLSCIGEGNGNPLQCSCLENPRDGGVWWAAVYGVAQSRTRLTRLSSSSSSKQMPLAFDLGAWQCSSFSEEV